MYSKQKGVCMLVSVNTQINRPLVRPVPTEEDPHADRCRYCSEEAAGITDFGFQSCGDPICGVVVHFFEKEPAEE